jgi:hypothetical protein
LGDGISATKIEKHNARAINVAVRWYFVTLVWIFSFSADVSGRTSIMETTTYSPKLYWKTCAALMALLALTRSNGYLNFGSFNLVVALGDFDL